MFHEVFLTGLFTVTVLDVLFADVTSVHVGGLVLQEENRECLLGFQAGSSVLWVSQKYYMREAECRASLRKDLISQQENIWQTIFCQW